MARFELTDDGTMDTVLRCCECGEELRYNYDPACLFSEDEPEEAEDAYDAFVDWAFEDAENEHECEQEQA